MSVPQGATSLFCSPGKMALTGQPGHGPQRVTMQSSDWSEVYSRLLTNTINECFLNRRCRVGKVGYQHPNLSHQVITPCNWTVQNSRHVKSTDPDCIKLGAPGCSKGYLFFCLSVLILPFDWAYTVCL